MNNYTSHSKLVFTNYDKIQKAIDDKLIDVNDIIICEDTKEFILVREDLSLLSIKSRVYRFPDYETAEKTLNQNIDTYEGQLVAVLSEKGVYEAYIVNRNSKGTFYITPMNAYTGSIDYDTLGHRPIINLYGAIESPVVLDEQKNGLFAVNGNYKISNNLETIFSSESNNFFIISHLDNDIVKIKKIGIDEIIDYTIYPNGEVKQYIIPTTAWIQEQGYATELYVNQKIEALEIVTRQELEVYVTEVIENTLDTTIDRKIEEKFNDKFQPTTEEDIRGMFQ